MSKITRTLSTRTDAAGECQIFLRLTISRAVQIRIKSGIYVSPQRFNDGRFVYPRRNPQESAALLEKENRLVDLERHIVTTVHTTAPDKITKELLQRAVHRFHFPNDDNDNAALGISAQGRFYEVFTQYLDKPISEVRKRNLRCMARSLRRFELYKRTVDPGFVLDINNTTRSTLDEILNFWRNEHVIAEQYPTIFQESPILTIKTRRTRKPEPKGENALADLSKRLRAFFNWAVDEGYISQSPFKGYKNAPREKYGTPWYLTKTERDIIADADLSGSPALAVQRDIFVFQCLIGCRVSDLRRLTTANITGDAVQYIPSKTKEERPAAITVPLTARAKAILERYKENAEVTGHILPFISDQRYNDAIKAVLERCGITRVVTVINPTTGEEEQRRLCDIASSHMARRTFCGILYKNLKDPEIIGSMSGHAAGSRAFARYRDIDTETKQEAIKFLE